MKFKKNFIVLYVFYVIIILTAIWIILTLTQKRQETMQDKVDIELVVSRYNEDLEWLKDEPFNQYPCVVYNKGSNEEYYQQFL